VTAYGRSFHAVSGLLIPLDVEVYMPSGQINKCDMVVSTYSNCIARRRLVCMGKGEKMRYFKKASRRAIRRQSKYIIDEQLEELIYEKQ
jgi:hypothetical protein